MYFGLTDPVIYGGGLFSSGDSGIVDLREEKKTLTQAMEDAKALQERAAELERQAASISPDNITRLDNFLPDSVDDIQLVVDLNTIASRSGMGLGEVKLGADQTRRRSVERETGQAVPAVETVAVSFTVDGSYGQLKAMISDLAKSLRILEVKQLKFASVAEDGSETGRYKYEITVETYWLK